MAAKKETTVKVSKVKKPATKAAVKKSPKKVSVKNVVVKKVGKTTIKKTATKRPAKPKVKKRPVSKVVKAKSGAGKSVSKKTVARKSSATKKEKKLVETKPVVLPTNMSLRSIEKAKVIEREFDYFFKKPAYRIAYASGLCMIMVGSAYLAPNYIQNFSFSGQNALVAGTTDTVSVVQNTVSDSFQLNTNIPDEVTKSFPVSFSATNVDQVKSKLVREGHSGFIDVGTEITSNNNYRVIIPYESLVKDYYTLKFFVRTVSGDNKTYESKRFFVGKLTEHTVDQPDDSPINTVDSGLVDSGEVTHEEAAVLNANESEQTEIVPKLPTQEAVKKDSTVVEKDSLGVDNIVKIVQTTDQVETFRIFNSGSSELSGSATIGIEAGEKYSYIELYLRPVQSLNSRFVALATKRFEKWQFVFDTKDIPNGKYELYAQTKDGSKVIKSKTILVTVKNESTTPLSIQSDARKPIVSIAPAKTDDAREFVKVSDFEDVKSDSVSVETSLLLKQNSAEMNALLRNYAAAVQSGDEILISAAKDALRKKKDEIVFDNLKSERTQGIADSIEEDLDLRIQKMQEKVAVFEGIRKERSSGDSSVDTDKDGISDFDEVNIYKTNPELSDTDNDGVTDGIEIARGYDPNDSKVEAVIEYESPKESLALVHDDLIQVENVSPIKKVGGEGGDDTHLKTEIRGKSLPNSFVTLYIFSSPTVVTIKTDADGSFVYTFDRELEDGRHDVYAAVTDNAGEIIAQSNPFSFIKRAEAFTPVDAEEANVITNTSELKSSDEPYSVAAGVGILALGLILIMLGVSLRGRKNSADSDEGEVKVVTENIDVT
ncbi:hypothetical protein KC926_00950 [Candidatus Kaiserbacteria bacterium]|nr:hypothetical protein [Candidatus Kaiserbacteria bacterium]